MSRVLVLVSSSQLISAIQESNLCVTGDISVKMFVQETHLYLKINK